VANRVWSIASGREPKSLPGIGHWQLTTRYSPLARKQKGTTMASKASTTAVPQDIRAAAETTLAKAQEAIHTYLEEAKRLSGAVERSVQAAQAGASEVNRKTLGFAEVNVNAAFQFAQQLVKSKDPKDIATLNRTFLEEQIEQLNQQAKEIAQIASKAAAAPQAKQ
jgi:hypothetical protein